MPDMPKVGVEAVIEGMANFVRDAQKFNDETGGMAGAAQGAAGLLSDLGGVAAGALAAGFAIAVAGATALAGALVFSVGQALENEQTLARLDTVIRSTGGAAGLTSEEAQKLAQQFTGLAGGSDDAVLAIEEMALRMGTVTKEQMPAFIQTTLDLAAATGQDATAAARILAQAQEDPISALGRFRRMGILFTDAQKEQIKTLQDSGDVAGAAALVMDRLAEATGGAAQAQANTLAGQWKILQGTIGEAAESIGMAFLPVLHELFDTVIAPAIPVITEFGIAIGTAIGVLASGDIGGAFDALMEFDSVRAVFQGLGIDLRDVGGTVEDFVTNAQVQFTNLIAFFQPVIDAATNLAAAFIESMPMIQTYVNDMVVFVQGLIAQFAPAIVANVTTALNTMAEFWRAHGDEVMAVVNFVFRVVATVIGGTLTLISGIITATLQFVTGVWAAASTLLHGDTATAWAAIQLAVFTALQTILSTITTILDAALGIVGTDLESFRAVWEGVFTQVTIIVTTMFNNFKVWVSQGILDAIAAAQAIVGGFVDLGRAIVQGMISGVVNAAGGLAQAAINAVNAAIAAAKAAVGIESPSRVAMEEVGQPLGEGIAAGLMKALGTVQMAASTVSQGAIQAAAPGLVNMGGANTSNITNWNYSPTYGGQAPAGLGRDIGVMQALVGS